MPKTKTKQFNFHAPPEMHGTLRKMNFQYMYMNHADYKPIYEVIRDNPGIELSKLQYELRKQGLYPSIAGMKKIAHWCDLPYKE